MVENRAGLARYLGVSRARVTQVLRRLKTDKDGHPPWLQDKGPI